MTLDKLITYFNSISKPKKGKIVKHKYGQEIFINFSDESGDYKTKLHSSYVPIVFDFTYQLELVKEEEPMFHELSLVVNISDIKIDTKTSVELLIENIKFGHAVNYGFDEDTINRYLIQNKEIIFQFLEYLSKLIAKKIKVNILRNEVFDPNGYHEPGGQIEFKTLVEKEFNEFGRLVNMEFQDLFGVKTKF